MTEKTKKKRKTDENTIFVGNKPSMSYVLAVVTQFNNISSNEVIVKARGRAISRAVDVVEVCRRRFLPDVEVKRIDIGTEQLAPFEEGGSPTNVSTIEIKLAK